MPRRDTTYHPADIIRIWSNNLTLDEQTQVMIFFQYVVRDLISEVVSQQGDVFFDVVFGIFRRRAGGTAGLVRLIRQLFRPAVNVTSRFVILAFDARTRIAVGRAMRENPLLVERSE